MTRYKSVWFYVLLAALTLAAIEGMSRLAYFLAFDQWYRGGLPEVPAADSRQDRAREYSWWRISHPFYGYTHSSPNAGLNVLPPQGRADDVVVIGVLGGSVAWYVLPYFRRAVEQYFAANALPRRPVIVELSLRGTRQPVQAIAAANALALGGRFDLMVNLDGRNEIAHGADNLGLDRYPFLPWTWAHDLELTDAEARLVGRISVLREREEKRRRDASSSPFRYTASYGLLNSYRLQRTTAAIIQLNHELNRVQTAYNLELHGPRWRSGDVIDAAIFPESAWAWYRGSLLLSELAKLTGAEYYHFQQPSQYVPGAKPLTAAELDCCYKGDGSSGTAYRETYPLLLTLGERLRQQGVNYFDLNGIFADNHETLYRDACCHLNDRGNELLAAALVRRLEPGFRRAAAAADRVSPLAAAEGPAPSRPPDVLLLDAPWRVYRSAGHRLRYVKADCSPEDAPARFFLEITPVNPAHLPVGKQEKGFESREFRFEDAGTGIGGSCIAEIRLPLYPIAAIRTGQYAHDGATLWARNIPFADQEATGFAAP